MTTPSPFDPPAGQDRRTAAVRGGLLTLGSRLGVDLVRLVRTAILSRLLGAREFGLVAMTSGTLGVANVLRDGGLSTATVQHPGLTHGQVAASHRVNVTMGLTLGVATFLLAPVLGAALQEPGVVPLARALSVMFILDGLATQHVALLARRTDFRSQSLLDGVSASSSLAVAGILAWQGAGVWALIGGMLTSSLVTLLFARHRSGYHAQRPVWDSETWSMMKLGVQFAAFALLNFLGHNLHLVLIGRSLGADSAGVYGRAQTAFLLAVGYMAAVPRRVAVPQMSRIRDESEVFAHYFRRAVSGVAVMSAGVTAFAFVHADLVVRVLLGPGWEESAQLLGVLAVGILVNPVCAATGWIYIARGDARRLLKWGVVGWTIQIAGSLAGLPFGAMGVAIGYTAALLVLTPFCLWYAFIGTQLRTAPVLLDVSRPLLVAIAAAVATLPLRSLIGGGPFVQALLVGLIFVSLYLAGLLMLSPTRQVVRYAHEIVVAPAWRALRDRIIDVGDASAAPGVAQDPHQQHGPNGPPGPERGHDD